MSQREEFIQAIAKFSAAVIEHYEKVNSGKPSAAAWKREQAALKKLWRLSGQTCPLIEDEMHTCCNV